MNVKKFFSGFNIIRVIAILMLLVAFADNPYGYYIFLRWIICPISLYCALTAHRQNSERWIWIFGVNALVYNPIISLHLGKSIWGLVNLVSIVFIFTSFFYLKEKNSKD